MKNAYQWGLNKPQIIREESVEIAKSATQLFEVIEMARSNQMAQYFSEIQITDWFRLYHGSKKLKHFTETDLLTLDQTAATLVTDSTKYHQVNYNTKHPNSDDIEEQLWKRQTIENLDVNTHKSNEKLQESQREIVLSTEFYFLIKIAIPCWILFQKPHSLLFRQAPKGSPEAIDTLLRLDKALVRHPRINKWFDHYYSKDNLKVFDGLCLALREPLTKRIDLQSVKYCLSGYISYLSEKRGRRLNSTEIRDLFNCIAKDQDSNLLIDEDIAARPDSFRQAIKRYRAFDISPSPPPPDIE